MRALFSLLVTILSLTACSQNSDRRELRVSVFEEHLGVSPKVYDGNVRYSLTIVCDGEPDKTIAKNRLGSSQLTLPWLSALECKDGVIQLRYAIMTDWMRCDGANGIEPIDVRSPQIMIVVNCDP